MRRFIVLLLVGTLCGYIYAEDVGLAKYQFWFDQNRIGETTGLMNNKTSDTISFSIDTYKLPQGVHTLFYRVQDTAGNWSSLSSWLFYNTPIQSDSLALLNAEYWIDNGYSNRTSVNGNNGNYSFLIDASSLAEGLHTLYYRAKDSFGRYSSTSSWMFLRNALKDTATVNAAKKLEYWFDADSIKMHSLPVDSNHITVSINTTELKEGVHTLFYRVQDTAGNWSSLSSWLFYNTPIQSDSLALLNAEYWIDNGYSNRTSINGNNGNYSFLIDASSLAEGLHTLYYRAKDSFGRYSSTSSWMFLRNALKDTATVNVAKKLEYWFDADYQKVSSLPMDSNNIAVSIGTTGLADGLHTLNYRVQDTFGVYSSPGTWMFIKQSGKKPSKITKYKYWWNNHTDQTITELVNEDSTDIIITTQLTIPEYAKTDGYSSNSTARLSVMFCNDAGNWSQVTTADVRYPDVIPPVSEIHADKEVTSDEVNLTWNVVNDEVMDYNVYVAEGDQPFVLWMPNTTKTTAVFKGQPDTTYKFTVTARDLSNNAEILNEDKTVKVEFKNTENKNVTTWK